MGAGASAQDVPQGRILMHDVPVPEGVGAGDEFEFEHNGHMFKATVPKGAKAGLKVIKVKVAVAREKKVPVPKNLKPGETFEAILSEEKNIKVTLECPKVKRPGQVLTCKWIESLGAPKESAEGTAVPEEAYAHQVVPEIWSDGAPPDDHSGVSACPDQAERLMHYFQDADLEGTGELTFPELCMLCDNMGVGLSKEEVAQLYGKIDVDDSHSISLVEIIAAAPVLFPTIAAPDKVELGWEIMCYFDGAGYYQGIVMEYLADKSGGMEPKDALFKVAFDGDQEYELSTELVYRGRADYMIGRGDEAVYEESEGLTVEGTQVVAQGPVGVSQFIIDALLAAAMGNDWEQVTQRLQEAFTELDVNQSGKLSKEEFHALDSSVGMGFDRGFLELMFEELDQDMAGELTHEECMGPLLENIKEMYAPGGAAMAAN